MVNHLYRSRNDRRHQQATLLNEWAQTQTAPIVAVGDYNFDWDIANGESDHDQGYDNMTADGVFEWVQPATLIKTQCCPRFNSILDFVFVAGDALGWTATSEIAEIRGGYCTTNNSTESDHRPVFAFLEPEESVVMTNEDPGVLTTPRYELGAVSPTVVWVLDRISGKVKRCESNGSRPICTRNSQ